MSVFCGIFFNMGTVYTPNMRRKIRGITELYILWSELCRHKLSPTLATIHYCCRDNAIGLVAQSELSGYVKFGYLLKAVGWKFSYYYQCRCWCKILDSNRNTKNVKIAVKNANFCRKKYVICARCSNMRKMRQYVKYAAVAYSHKTDMPSNCLCVDGGSVCGSSTRRRDVPRSNAAGIQTVDVVPDVGQSDVLLVECWF